MHARTIVIFLLLHVIMVLRLCGMHICRSKLRVYCPLEVVREKHGSAHGVCLAAAVAAVAAAVAAAAAAALPGRRPRCLGTVAVACRRLPPACPPRGRAAAAGG